MTQLAWRRSRELVSAHLAIFALLTLWALGPLAMTLIHVARHGGVLTGAFGTDGYDQLAYLAWIRDEGDHLLASNLWSIAPTPHDYLHPMFLISGLLWRLGASIQLAYLIWIPVALLVLFLGFAAYARRHLDFSRRAQAAALLVALFYETPLMAVGNWTSLLSPGHRFQLLLASDDANAAFQLWGFDHTAIAIGLMPVFLLAVERLLRPRADERTRIRGWTALAAVAGALVSWLRPWQGVTLLAVIGLVFVLRPPRRRFFALTVPVVATILPLIYGVVLARADPSWASFQAKTTQTGTAPWWALLASFGPLVALAALGVRPLPGSATARTAGSSRGDGEWMLRGWVLGCAAVYFLIPEFPPHALSGVTLPLAVLAVRGFRRLRLSRLLVAPAAAGAIAAVTVPTAVYHAQSVRDDFTKATYAPALEMELLSGNQAAALRFIANSPRPGAVLAPPVLSMSVPGLTGRTTFAGHFMWQPPSNVAEASRFFDPTLRDPRGTIRRSILGRSTAAFVISDCGTTSALASALSELARPVRRFGCVTVYETRPGATDGRSAR